MTGYRIKIKENPVLEMTCLVCKQPDMSTQSSEQEVHLQILGNIVSKANTVI